MSRPLIVAIHGILTGQTDATWPARFGAHCEHAGVNAKVITKEYQAGPTPLWNLLWTNPRITRGLVAEIMELPNRPVYFVAHSNGTDIALKAIKALAKEGVRTQGFVAIGSVLPPQVEENGVIELIAHKLLGKAIAYCGKRDRAIGLTSRLPSAYSRLGVTGWEHSGKPYESEHVRSVFWDDYGHSSWFEPSIRAATFDRVLEDFELNNKKLTA